MLDTSTETDGWSDLQSGVVVVTGLESGTTVVAPLANGGQLNDSNNTLTVKLDDVMTKDKYYSVTVKGVKDENAKEITPYTQGFKMNEITAPTVKSISAKTNADSTATVKVEFSEPVNFNSVKIDGEYAQSASNDSNFGSKYILTAKDALDAGSTYKVEFNGLEDLAGNVAATEIYDVTVVKDTVKPTYTVKATGEKTFEIAFDKDMSSTVEPDFVTVETQDDPAVTVAQANLAVRKSDKRTFKVTLASYPIASGKDSVDLDVTVKGFKDTLGNEVKKATTEVTLSKDVVKPTVNSVSMVAGTDNKIKVVFSEKVTAADGKDFNAATLADIFALTNNDGSIVRLDDATEVGFASATAINSDKEVVVTLDNALPKAGTYKLAVKVNSVKDTANTANKNVAVVKSFNYNKDAATVVQLTASITATTDGSTDTDSSAENRLVKIHFNRADVVNGIASATGDYKAGAADNLANYTVDGVALPEGTVVTFIDNDEDNNDNDSVVLDFSGITDTKKIPDGLKNGGELVITVANVKTEQGSTLRYTTKAIDVVDATAPTIKSAYITGTTGSYKLTVVFSEKMSDVDESDFVLTDGTEEATLGTAVISSDASKATITVTIGDVDLTKTLTLKTVASPASVDASEATNGLTANETGITVTNYTN